MGWMARKEQQVNEAHRALLDLQGPLVCLGITAFPV